MDDDVLEAMHVRDHIVWVRCRDGRSGEVDLGPDPMFRTLTWPNGADIAPEFLYDNVRVTV